MKPDILLLNTLDNRVATFQKLREITTLHYSPDKIYWLWREGITALNAYNIPWEINYQMARQNSSFNDWTFANIRLSTADEKSFAKWYTENETSIMTMLGEVVADTYKFSLSYDFDNECFIAGLSGTRYSELNKKTTLTARSNEWLEAIALVLYKHVVMCTMGEWADYARPSNWG